MKKAIAIGIILIFIFGVFTIEAYATNIPAENEGQKAVQEQAKSHHLEIESFKKTDGKSGMNNGVATYEMYYEVNAKGLVHKGKKITGKGSIVFEKRENGWVSIVVKGLPTDEMTYNEEMKKSQDDHIKAMDNAAKLPKEVDSY